VLIYLGEKIRKRTRKREKCEGKGRKRKGTGKFEEKG
jgi:hypothetical protein